MAEHVIVTDGLVRRFGANVAVDNLSIAIDAGDVFGFLGPQWCGQNNNRTPDQWRACGRRRFNLRAGYEPSDAGAASARVYGSAHRDAGPG